MNYYLLISSIIIIILAYFVGKSNERFSNSIIIKEYIENTENDRNIAMNGIDLKYYINFAFHYKLFNLFEIVINELDKNNINYFLICGGLIGYHRHNNGFIPWDDDIDIGVMEEDRERLHNVINNLIKTNDKIRLGIHDIDKVLYNYSDNNPIQIDIFYFKFYSDKNYFAYYMDKLINIWPNEYLYKDEIFPLNSVPFILYDINGNKFKEINIKIPNQSTKYLDRAYKNWEIVKKPSHIHSEYYKLMFGNE